MDEVWRFQPHPEIWALIIGLAGLWWFALARIGPTATLPGEPVVTRAQVRWGIAALVTLWLASDWPVHDIGEEYLYSAHMAQHMLFSFVVAPMVLLATPTWLARMLIGGGRAYRVVRWLTRLVPATLLFNGVVVLSHWPLVVNNVVDAPFMHYGVHMLVMGSALVMWFPVCGPFPELRFTLPVQMGFLFLQSVVPTVPAGWLVFADKVVYKSYDIPERVFGLSAVWDQQLAATFMKIGGGLFLWTVIVILFVRFAEHARDDDRAIGVDLDRRAPV